MKPAPLRALFISYDPLQLEHRFRSVCQLVLFRFRVCLYHLVDVSDAGRVKAIRDSLHQLSGKENMETLTETEIKEYEELKRKREHRREYLQRWRKENEIN